MKIKLMPVLIAVCVLLAAVAAVSVVQSLNGDYDPEQYLILADYQNVTVQDPREPVTDEDVNDALETLLQQLATTQPVTDGAADGDTVRFAYEAHIENSDGLSDQNAEIVLGQDGFILPGLDPYLTGAKPGDVIRAALTVPENHFVMDDVGKTAQVSATVHEVLRTTVPALTDELAGNLGYATADAFKAAFAQQFKAQREQENEVLLRNALWSAVVEDSVVRGYPQKPLEELMIAFRQQVQAGADEYGMEYYEYASFAYGTADPETFDAYVETYCQSVLKQKMVLKAICKRENITLTDEEYRRYVADYLTLYDDPTVTESDLIDAYGGQEDLREQFLMEKATDVIQQTATVTP